MEQTSTLSSQQDNEPDFSLKEWALKARLSRENTSSRRFSASNLKSFREDHTRSFRSNMTISSATSSPGYTVREEIDPSTYSFTTALKALQAKTVYTWEYLSPDGLTLNSKWNDAEKYICNPLSGEVPLECLSAKTLSTMSAPLIYPSSQMQHYLAKSHSPISEHDTEVEVKSQEKKGGTTSTRDVGTQSTPVELSSSSPSPAPTPSIEERSFKLSERNYSPVSSVKLKSETEVEVKETREKQCTKRNDEGETKKQMMCRCSNRQLGGCVPLRGLWMHRDKHKSRTSNTSVPSALSLQY